MPQQPTPQQWDNVRAREARLLAFLATPVTAHDVDVAGQSLHYLEAGSPKLPTLVMLHGRGSAAALYFPILPLLAPHRHIIAIDMRGWGLSSRAPFTGHTGAEAIAWWRAGVLTVIDALGIGRFDLLGHSLGGMVALAVALERQAQIDHLVLEDAAGFGGATPFPSRLYFAVKPERLARWAPRAIFNRASAGSVPVQFDNPEKRQALQDFLYALTTLPGTSSSGAWAFDHISGIWGPKYTLKDQVYQIQTPTRGIWGADDNVVRLDKSRPALNTMPNVEVVVIPHTGHSPHFDQPAAFTQSVLEFLARGPEHLDLPT